MTAKLSVIIAYYRNEVFLSTLFNAFEAQTNLDFEVIIAEDDNTLNLEKMQVEKYSFSIFHVSQEDKGFRKCRILNQAIQESNTDRIVFIDGDCIPHPNFILSYLALSDYACVFGRRVMLSKKHSQQLLQNRSGLSFLELLSKGSRQIRHSFHLPWRKPTRAVNKGIWGCNWAVNKELLNQVNGFDEDYILAGIGEDVDIEWRLRKLGIEIFYAKHRPIVYHLHHKEHYNEEIVNQNLSMLKEKKKEGLVYCSNGLQK